MLDAKIANLLIEISNSFISIVASIEDISLIKKDFINKDSVLTEEEYDFLVRLLEVEGLAYLIDSYPALVKTVMTPIRDNE